MTQSGDLVRAISLFTSVGLGDLALAASGAEILVANELNEQRASIYRRNFPDTTMVEGDIWSAQRTIVDETRRKLNGKRLDMVVATPPCQGMSKNGRDRLRLETKRGSRSEYDERNGLILATLPIIRELEPTVVVIENVPEIHSARESSDGGPSRSLLERLREELPDYWATWKTVDFADYGVPQRRRRAIGVLILRQVSEQLGWSTSETPTDVAFPQATHALNPNQSQEPWVTVDDAIGLLPELDATKRAFRQSRDSLHHAAALDERKLWWVSHTPPGASAFDNQCVNPECRFQGNVTHGVKVDGDGIRRVSTETPIYCARCGSLLPRPVVEVDGKPRLMRGFTSSYKRMRGDQPAPSITTRFPYVCSSMNIHPTQHRGLSTLEGAALQTVTDYDFIWQFADGTVPAATVIRDAIGEGVPPRGLETILRHLITHALPRRIGVNVKAPAMT